MTSLSRRSLITGAAALPLATPALASGRITWSMATSWGENAPGPGVSAARIATTITQMSGGRLTVKVYPAGTLVPAFGVFDAVADQTCQLGHTASVFNSGKIRAAALFTSAPFGMKPIEHNAWLAGDGAALWRALYAPFDILPFAASNTGPSLGVWTREPVRKADDLTGLKMRIAGLGGELFRRLGVTPVSVPPGEIGVSLKSGVIDAAEFASAVADEALGLYRSAQYCQIPAFHEPNGVAEALVGARVWEALDSELRAIVKAAFAAEHHLSLAESLRDGTAAMARMRDEEGTEFRAWPDGIVDEAAALAPDVLASVAEQGEALDGRIVDSYRTALAAMRGA